MKPKCLARLNECRTNLAKYKAYEGEHEEGYDGHQEWNNDDKLLLDAIAFFYKAVKKRYYLEVRTFLGILLPGGPDDARLQPIQRLLTNTPSEEALKEALLLSIMTGSRPLVEFVLALFIDCPYLERSGCYNSANFPPHMTPLMLACIMNNFSVVECLLLRGHTIQIPHYLSCECATCRRQTVSTRTAQRMADVMRAVSSEAFLWLGTDDVVAAACHVARDLQKLMDDDNLEQIEIYRTLELNVQRFLARVSDQAWRAEEFNALVVNKVHCSNANSELASPRLQLAMDAHMRQFTCSSNVQTSIKSVFRSDWFNYGNKLTRDVWRTARATIFMPLLVLLHMVVPTKGTTMAVPLARFLAHIATYLLFLAAAIGRPIYGFYTDWQYTGAVFPRILEGFIYIYILGLLVEKTVLYKKTNGTFYAFWWRWLDAIFITLYICAFAAHAATWIRSEHFEPSTVDRRHWTAVDPYLMHEIFLAMACVFGFFKVFYYLQLIKGIGASIISVGKCLGKTYTYMVIMLIVMFSFSIGFNILIGPYSDRKAFGTDNAQTTDAYKDVGTSTKSLFWSIFGYLGPSTYVTVVGNTGDKMEPVNHFMNTTALEVLGALYHGIIIITVLNLMTSLLVKKADEVLDNEEMEFKYTRAAIYSEYLSWMVAAPPPLNLILIPFHFIHRKQRYYESPTWTPEQYEGKNEEEATLLEKSNTYAYLEVLHTLFQRFCASKECKYKSIWRSEFDKEDRRSAHVLYLTGGLRHFPIDNTYEGWRWRKSRKMKLPPIQLFTPELINNYNKKGVARKAVEDRNPQEDEIIRVADMAAQEPTLQNETNVEMPADFKGPGKKTSAEQPPAPAATSAAAKPTSRFGFKPTSAAAPVSTSKLAAKGLTGPNLV